MIRKLSTLYLDEMRSRRVVRASDSNVIVTTVLGSIPHPPTPTQWNRGAADVAMLNIVPYLYIKRKKNPPLYLNAVLRYRYQLV
jgi:hypothetical protein